MRSRYVPLLVLLALLAFMPPATAAKRTFRPAGATAHGRLTFELRHVRPESVRRARLHVGRHRRGIGVRRVRAAARRGYLHLRVLPRARTAKLVVQTSSCDVAPGRPPGACWRPYGAASPFNQPLPADPRIAPDSEQVVRRLLAFGPIDHLVAGTADTPDDYSHPTYYAQPDDPLFRLHCYEASWGRCEIEGMEIRVPDAARAAAGGDAHLTVVDEESGWEYDLYKVRAKPRGGGPLVFRWGGRTRIDGDGLGSAATAANFGSLAGIIRAPELESGRIDHALFMVARCDSGDWVYPAGKDGRSCAALGLPTADAPPMGVRLQLAMSPEQIDALDVPAWKRTILRAMAEYGLIMGDTGGGAWGIQAESSSTYTSFGASDPLVDFALANDWTRYQGRYVADLRSDVDWARHLRVIAPCVSRGTC